VSSDIVVERGAVLIYRVFEVAESIDLATLQELAGTGTFRLEIGRPRAQALVIRNAPVSVVLGPQDIAIGGATYTCHVQARVWDYGVVSLLFRLPLAAMSWDALLALAGAIETSTDFEAPARRALENMLAIISPAVHERHHWDGLEDYVIYFVESVRGATASDLLERADVAALLLGETTQPLSARTRRAVVESWFQYWAHDLAVIDWNSALIIEPSGVRDLPDVIEFALTHLVEFRYYDDLLDHKLASLYTAISQSERRRSRTNYEAISREASALFVDISEFVERVENSLKVIGDFYLATIFRASVNRLRLREWEGSVTRKLQLLARVSELLSAQLAAHRSYRLEWVVTLLIAFEIVWALVRH
jgi:hypothetical protein